MASTRIRACWVAFANSLCGRILAEPIRHGHQKRSPSPTEGSEKMSDSKIRSRKCREAARSGMMTAWDWVFKWVIVIGWIVASAYSAPAVLEVFGLLITTLQPSLASLEVQAATMYTTFFPQRSVAVYGSPILVTLTLNDPHAEIDENVLESRPVQQFEQMLRYKLECPFGVDLAKGSSIECFTLGRTFFKEIKSWQRLQQRWLTLTRPVTGDICTAPGPKRKLQQTQGDFIREHSDVYEPCLPAAGRIKCSGISGAYRASLATFEPLGIGNCFQRCLQNNRCNFFFFQPSSSAGQGTNGGQLCALYSHCTEMEVTATAADVGSLYRIRRATPDPLATTTTAQHAGRFRPPPKPPLMQQAQSLFITDDKRTMVIELRAHLDALPEVIHKIDLIQDELRPWVDSYGQKDEFYDPMPLGNFSTENPESLSPLRLAEGARVEATYVGATGWASAERAAAKELKEKFTVRMSLVPWQLHASGKAVERDFINTDRVTLPIAWAVVASMVGMPALLMLLPLAVSAIMSFRAVLPMTKIWSVPVFAPSVFICLLIALSIDYGLFMLVKFRESTVKDNLSNREAVWAMMNSAGKAVTYSGILLSVSCAGLGLVHVDLIRSIGIGASMTIMITLVVNLTIIPSCLLIIGRPLQRCMRWLDRSCKSSRKKTSSKSFGRPNAASLIETEDDLAGVRSMDGDDDEPAYLTQRALVRKMVFEQPDPFPCCCCRYIWRMTARLTSRHPIKAILVVFMFASPFIYQLLFFQYSVAFSSLYVRDDPAYIDAAAMMEAGVYVGEMAPFTMIVTKAEETRVPTGNFPAPAPSACRDDDRAVASNVQRLKKAAEKVIDDKKLLENINSVYSCADAAKYLGSNCATWTVAGFDLSKMAVTYCPYTCRKCQGMGAKALADGAPPLLSALNYNISREIRRRMLLLKRDGSHTALWDRYNGTNVLWQLLLNGGLQPDTDFFAPETRDKIFISIVSPYGALISRARAVQLLRYAEKAIAPAPNSPDAYERSLVDVAPYVYLGCYKDNGDSDSEGPIEYRDIKAFQGDFPSEMTVEYCAHLCLGRLYFAVQHGSKCFCSDFYPSNPKTKASKCKTPCSGGCTKVSSSTTTTAAPAWVRPAARMRTSLKACGACGGESLNSVYRFQADRFHTNGVNVGQQMEAELYHRVYSDLRSPTDTASLFLLRANWMSDGDTGADFLRKCRQLSGERLNPHKNSHSDGGNSSSESSNNIPFYTAQQKPASVVPGSADFWQHQTDDNAPGFTFRTYIHSQVGIIMDVIDDLFAKVPLILTLGISGAVLLLSSLAFCSVFIALRLLITLGLTLSMVFGMATLAYGHRGVSWLAIIVCAPIMVGLTMDYDMFLSTHIYELRKDERYNTRHSVLKGLAESGTTITTAGIIMTVAFAALMLSQITVLNQFGFLLVCVSVVDTFMVRAVLVPALMLLIGEKNWWPGKMPPGNHQIDAEGEDAWLLEHTEASDGMVCCWDQWSCCARRCRRATTGVTPLRVQKVQRVEFVPI